MECIANKKAARLLHFTQAFVDPENARAPQQLLANDPKGPVPPIQSYSIWG